jgi:hypothetical protein
MIRFGRKNLEIWHAIISDELSNPSTKLHGSFFFLQENDL